jgi:chromosomal replication initiation ATPase DnaA
MAEPLSCDLPARAALERDDFFISPSNALALALIDRTEHWPNGKLVLIGPEGAGKTHLASVWAAQTQAQITQAKDLAAADIDRLAQAPTVVENLDHIAGDRSLETALFHLHNLAAANAVPLLVTTRLAPHHLPLALPDLASRMQAAQIAELSAPDDTLLAAVLMKLFADRQIAPAPDVIPYLTLRIDRSFAAAQRTVAALDKAAMQSGRKLTRKLAGSVLDNLV